MKDKFDAVISLLLDRITVLANTPEDHQGATRIGQLADAVDTLASAQNTHEYMRLRAEGKV